MVLLLVMDPVGNIPFFIALLGKIEPSRRRFIIARECLVAFLVLLVFALFGTQLLPLLGLSQISVNIAGGVILLIIALRIVFRHPEGIFGNEAVDDEPFIVPLAIPALAGPSAIAMTMLLVSRDPERMPVWLGALATASFSATVILLFAEGIARRVGPRSLRALERLLGLLLTAVAVEMLLNGIGDYVRQF